MPLHPSNPAKIEAFPPTLPIEVALRVAPVPDIFRAYGLGKADFERITRDPSFIVALEECVEELRDPKKSFRMKARLQAEALLTNSWDLINAPNAVVSPQVKAGLIQATWKAAGVDGGEKQVQKRPGAALQINILMNDED